MEETFDGDLVERLRAGAREGADVASLVRTIQSRLGLTTERVPIYAYFRRAFGLRPSQIGIIGGWTGFGDAPGNFSDEDLQREIGHLIGRAMGC